MKNFITFRMAHVHMILSIYSIRTQSQCSSVRACSAAVWLSGDVRGCVSARGASDVRVKCGRVAARRHQTAALRRAAGARAHVEHRHLELDS